MNAPQHDSVLEHYRQHFPPLITFQQAAEIAQRPLKTVYDWSSRGYFDAFKHRLGRERRLLRDPFVLWMLNSEA